MIDATLTTHTSRIGGPNNIIIAQLSIFFLHQLTPQLIPLVADPDQFASEVLRIVPRAGKLFFDVLDVASSPLGRLTPVLLGQRPQHNFVISWFHVLTSIIALIGRSGWS